MSCQIFFELYLIPESQVSYLRFNLVVLIGNWLGYFANFQLENIEKSAQYEFLELLISNISAEFCSGPNLDPKIQMSDSVAKLTWLRKSRKVLKWGGGGVLSRWFLIFHQIFDPIPMQTGNLNFEYEMGDFIGRLESTTRNVMKCLKSAIIIRNNLMA